jgi:hypothetical protein
MLRARADGSWSDHFDSDGTAIDGNLHRIRPFFFGLGLNHERVGVKASKNQNDCRIAPALSINPALKQAASVWDKSRTRAGGDANSCADVELDVLYTEYRLLIKELHCEHLRILLR